MKSPRPRTRTDVKPFSSKTAKSIFFEEKFVFFCSFVYEVFPIFSVFFELGELRDHSQIVDLIFPLRTVASRPSEFPKTPHS